MHLLLGRGRRGGQEKGEERVAKGKECLEIASHQRQKKAQTTQSMTLLLMTMRRMQAPIQPK